MGRLILFTRPMSLCLILVAAMTCALGVRAAAEDALAERCRALQQQPQQAIVECESAFAQLAGDASVEQALEMLFRRSDAELAMGDYAAAQASLERAAALPGALDVWKGRYRLQRRSAILAYRRGQFAEALSAFRESLDLAVIHGDVESEGQSWNDLGNALRRIGSYREALQAYLASLQRKRSMGDSELGPLMTNLGDLYRDLDDPDSARNYYLQAIELHQAQGRSLRVAHVNEALATLALDTRDYERARQQLNLAAAVFLAEGARPDQLRVAARRARLELDLDQRDAARQLIAEGQSLAQSLAIPVSADLSIESARLELLDGAPERARQLLVAALAHAVEGSPEHAALLALQARALRELGRTDEAYTQLLLFQQVDARLRTAEHDERLQLLRVRFEVAEKDRSLAALAAKASMASLALRQRTLQIWLLAALALLGMSLLGFLTYRSRERQRIAAARRESQLQTEADHFRAAAAALEADVGRVQALLDQSESALLALDASATIVAANNRAALILGGAVPALSGRRLDEFLDADSVARLSHALERIDECDARLDLSFQLSSGSSSPVFPSRLVAHQDVDGTLVLVQLDVGAQNAPDTSEPTRSEPIAVVVDGTSDQEHADGFRRELVELMLAALAAWQQSMRSDAIELAQKSRIWRVAIDDGRVRVRAMERYLSLAKIPRQPRWREVLRTAYFVLAEAPLDAESRADLRRRCEAIQAWVRRRAVV